MDNVTNSNPNFYAPDDLRNALRLLFQQYVVWTRFYIISKISNLGDLEIVMDRLLRIPMYLDNIMTIYYGKENADRLANVFREHLLITINYVNCSEANNTTMLNQLNEEWYKNADNLAAFLSSINPYWNTAELQNLFYDHINMTKDEIDKRIRKQYVNDIFQYDLIEYHALMIADIIWNGIINQFYQK